MNSLEKNVYITIKDAKYVNGYKIRIDFNDGKSNIVDFEVFLKNASNPMTRDYLDINKFRKFTIRDGDIDWNDYELCFPIADLYEGSILLKKQGC
jgi:hypothetical protein